MRKDKAHERGMALKVGAISNLLARKGIPACNIRYEESCGWVFDNTQLNAKQFLGRSFANAKKKIAEL